MKQRYRIQQIIEPDQINARRSDGAILDGNFIELIPIEEKSDEEKLAHWMLQQVMNDSSLSKIEERFFAFESMKTIAQQLIAHGFDVGRIRE